MRIEKKGKEKEKDDVIEIQEETRIPQGDHFLVLEKGDRVRIIKESIFRPMTYTGKLFDDRDLALKNVKNVSDPDLFWISDGRILDRNQEYISKLEKSIKDMINLSNTYLKELERIMKEWPS